MCLMEQYEVWRDELSQTVTMHTKHTTPKTFCKKMKQNSFPWYKEDDNGMYHCAICRTAKKGNSYALGHPLPAKTTNHQRHSSSRDHLDAQAFLSLKEELPMQNVLATKLDKDDKAVTSAMKDTDRVSLVEVKTEVICEEQDHTWLQEGSSASPLPCQLTTSNKRKVTELATEDDVLQKSCVVMSKETDEYETFGAFVASEIRGLKSDSNKKKLKRMIQRAILEVGERDDEEEEFFAFPPSIPQKNPN